MDIDDNAISLEQRLSDWNESLALSCGQYSTQLSDAASFTGCVSISKVSDIELSSIATNAHCITKCNVDEPSDSLFHYFIVLQQRGRSLFEQAGRQLILNTGDMTIMDQRLPCKLTHDGEVKHLSIHLPIHVVNDYLDEDNIGVARKINIKSGMGFLLKVYLEQLEFLLHHDNDQLSLVNDQQSLINLWGNTIPNSECLVSRLSMSNIQFNQLKIALYQQLSDPTINIEYVAKQHHISKSKLYRFFAKQQLTPNAWLKQLRLDYATRLMKERVWLNKPIIDVANGAGFDDLAHFTRSFTSFSGVSPHRYRTDYFKNKSI
ncbi:MAG: helix-turn-helix domain-containing protein [Psychrobium sp.]